MEAWAIFCLEYNSLFSQIKLIISLSKHMVKSRGVTRVEGSRGKKQVFGATMSERKVFWE